MIKLLKENKYLNIAPFSSEYELLNNFSFFYLIPSIILDTIFFLILYKAGSPSLWAYLKSILSIHSLLIVIIALGIYTIFIFGKFILAYLNILCTLQNDFNYPLSLGKKVGIFFLTSLFPISITAAFITFIALKKTQKYKAIPLFIFLLLAFFAISFSFDRYVSSPLLERNAQTLARSPERPKGEPTDPGIKSKTLSFKSKYLGKTFETKVPLFYQSGFPKTFRFNSGSLIKEDRQLVEFKNSCSNCLDHDRLEGPLRLEFVPTGTKLKIINSFSYETSSFGLDKSRYEYIVTEDDHHVRAEVTESSFEQIVINADIKSFDDSPPIMPFIEEFNNFKELELVVCSITNLGYKHPDPVKNSDKIYVTLHRFINDFKIQKDLEIKKIATMLDDKRNNSPVSCALLNFKNLLPLYLLAYYRGDWYIGNDLIPLERFYIYQNSEFKNFDYEKFIKLNESEALAY